MIDSLRIRNFRSIALLETDLPRFACLVGPNGAGKSNLVDAIAFARDVACEGSPVAGQDRPAAGLRYHGAEPNEPIDIELRVGTPHVPGVSGFQYRCALIPDGKHEVLESVTGLPGDGGPLPGAPGRVVPRRSPSARLSPSAEPGAGGPANSEHGHDHPPEPERSRERPPFPQALATMKGWRFYDYRPLLLKQPNPAHAPPSLAREGGNFASYLRAVHDGHPREFDHIEEQLKKSFPEVEALVTPTTRDQTYVGVREKWWKQILSGPQLSDGLVEFLAHLVVLYGPEEPTLLCFETPERHLHARLLEKLVAMLKDASRSYQVILTTHSPALLNHLRLEDLLLVGRDDGRTIVQRPAQLEGVGESLRGWALGDAYTSGLLERPG